MADGLPGIARICLATGRDVRQTWRRALTQRGLLDYQAIQGLEEGRGTHAPQDVDEVAVDEGHDTLARSRGLGDRAARPGARPGAGPGAPAAAALRLARQQ